MYTYWYSSSVYELERFHIKLSYIYTVIKNKIKQPNSLYTTHHQTGKSSGRWNATGSFNDNTCINVIDVLPRVSN